jgi:Arc-like DNA binding domain
MARKPTDIVQYKLRIRESLRRYIEEAAKKNGVSANQEMVRRLESSFERETQRTIESWFEHLNEQTRHLGKLVAAYLSHPDGDHVSEKDRRDWFRKLEDLGLRKMGSQRKKAARDQ